MARVKRFIFNSDFMTVAKNSRQVLTVTIPAGETLYGMYAGEKQIALEIPAACWPRCKVKYTATNKRTQETACDGAFTIAATKSGKTINYICTLEFSKDKLTVGYIVVNMTDTTTVLTDAQTVTITIDFMEQPNT